MAKTFSERWVRTTDLEVTIFLRIYEPHALPLRHLAYAPDRDRTCNRSFIGRELYQLRYTGALGTSVDRTRDLYITSVALCH